MVDLYFLINAVFTDERVNTAKSIDLVCANQFLISELTRQKLSMTHSGRALTKNFIKLLSPSNQKASSITLKVSVCGSCYAVGTLREFNTLQGFCPSVNHTVWGIKIMTTILFSEIGSKRNFEVSNSPLRWFSL